MSKKKQIFLACCITLAAAFLIAAVLIVLPGNAQKDKEVTFRIPRGQSLGTTARQLDDGDIIPSRTLFILYTILRGEEKNFKAGTYVIPLNANIRSLVILFSSGNALRSDVTVTIPEGTNLADMSRIFTSAGLLPEGALLGEQHMKLEGYLFPDTYDFYKTATAPDIIEKMKARFDEIAQKNNLAVDERTVIIASILEKEVQTYEDMRVVAGIIEKRLRLGMPLQVDASVAYGACYATFLSSEYCDVSEANLALNIRRDSTYNTYTRAGLPSGPISNPGLNALRAAANPQESEYLYYLSTKEGKTIFSKTLEEHNEARARYIK